MFETMQPYADLRTPLENSEERRAYARTFTYRQMVVYCLAIVAAAAAVIHFAVAGSHFQEYWLFGLFMLVAGWLQLLWACAAVVWPSRALWWIGTVLNAGIVVAYVVTRTIGDVVGPTPNSVEPVGFGDACCTVGEALLVAGCLYLLFSRRERRIEPFHLIVTCAFVGSAIATILSISLVAGGPEMVMTG